MAIFACFFIYAGISHFRNPRFFLKITPPWVPAPDIVNIIVGVLEIVLGLGLFVESVRDYAAWGLIVLLVAVFPANFYHHQKARAKGKHVIPTLIRMPIQGVLIYWAYTFIS